MKESRDQQAPHKPSPSTGSRQAAQSCGSATPSATPNTARAAPVRRAHPPVRVAEELADRSGAVLRAFPCGLDLGTPTDAVRRVLVGTGKVGSIIAANALAVEEAGRSGLAVVTDAEALPFGDGVLDLVVSGLA